MKRSIGFLSSVAAALLISLGVGVAVSSASADQVTLRNGDMLNGKVLTMTTNTLVLQDGSLGTLTLSRASVSNITFGTVAATAAAVSSGVNTAQTSSETVSEANAVSDAAASGLAAAFASPTSPQTNSNSASDDGLQAMAREILEHSNLVQEVSAQVLGSSASPEAVNKINDLLNGLSTGQLDMNGLRSEVQSAADQLQDYKKQMGSDAGEEVNAYLSILNAFLRETAPTNAPSAP